MSPKPRIAIAGFQHETNTFAPVKAQLRDFKKGGAWPAMTFGGEMIAAFETLNIPVGGFIRAAKHEADLVPIVWAQTEPSAHVTSEAFDYIARIIMDGIKNAGRLDGIYLDLHGAMVTEEHFDGEGELLRRLREVVGVAIPIVASLDFHANISTGFAELADGFTIYRSYPHLDMGETGSRAWPLLKRIIDTGRRPAKAFRQVDILVPLSAQCTEFGPLQTLYADLDKRVGAIVSADIAMGFPSADIPDAGPSVIVYSDTPAAAEDEADRLAAALCDCADQLDNTLLEPREAVRNAMALTADGGTVVLADVQDNSGAGALSDSTGLLTALIQERAEHAVLGAFWDPEAVARSRKAGLGAELELFLGGRHGPDGVEPLNLRVKVLCLASGRFRCTGEMQHDVDTDIGPSALLEILCAGKDLRVLVSSERHQALDQELFRHVGVEPSEQRIVAVKSTVHYRADFAPIAKAVLRVVAPGFNPCVLQRVTYRNLRPGVRIAQSL